MTGRLQNVVFYKSLLNRMLRLQLAFISLLFLKRPIGVPWAAQAPPPLFIYSFRGVFKGILFQSCRLNSFKNLLHNNH